MKNLEIEILSILRRLKSYNIDFIIVGGFAKYLHEIDNNFKDIDLFISKQLNSSENILRFLKSYSPNYTNTEYGFKDILRMRIGPIQIDFLPRLDGLKSKNIIENIDLKSFGSEEVKVISINDLYLNLKTVKQNIE